MARAVGPTNAFMAYVDIAGYPAERWPKVMAIEQHELALKIGQSYFHLVFPNQERGRRGFNYNLDGARYAVQFLYYINGPIQSVLKIMDCGLKLHYYYNLDSPEFPLHKIEANGDLIWHFGRDELEHTRQE